MLVLYVSQQRQPANSELDLSHHATGCLLQNSVHLADVHVLSRGFCHSVWPNNEAIYSEPTLPQAFHPSPSERFLPVGGFVMQKCAQTVVIVHIQCFEGFDNEPSCAEFRCSPEIKLGNSLIIVFSAVLMSPFT